MNALIAVLCALPMHTATTLRGLMNASVLLDSLQTKQTVKASITDMIMYLKLYKWCNHIRNGTLLIGIVRDA